MYFAVTNTGAGGADADRRKAPKARASSFQYRARRTRLPVEMAHTASNVAAAASRAILNRAVATPIEMNTIIGIATQAKYRTRKPTPTTAASAPPIAIGAMVSTARRVTALRAPDAVTAA